MKKIFYILSLCMFLFVDQAQSQTQVGPTFIGRNHDSQLGTSVAMSEDGLTAVLGARTDRLNSSQYQGYAEVYTWNGNTWIQKGLTIEGGDYDTYSLGFHVDISDDGNRILISGSRIFLVFDWNGSSWVQVGNSTSIYAAFNHTGIALSGDGNSVIYGNSRTTWPFEEKVEVYHLVGNIWQIKGSTLVDGPFISFFGSAVAINEDGSIISIGAKEPTADGKVFVYEWDGTDWSQLGGDIESSLPPNLNRFGKAIDLNGQGNRIIIATINGCEIYDFQNGSWSQVANNITTSGNRIVYEVNINDLGDVVAYGASTFADPGVNLVFKLTNNNWVQVGNEIMAATNDDHISTAIDLNGSGSRFITGAHQSSATPNQNGFVKVFDLPGFCDWEKQATLQINGESPSDQFGTAMKYTPDGNFLIAGTAYGDGNGSNSGEVRIFEKSGNTWTQRGATLLGEAAGDRFGGAVAISDNGKLVLVGARFNDGGGQNAGHARMFRWNGYNYVPYGNDIDGTSNFDYTGYTVDISNSGKYFAVGSPYNDDAGTNRGKIQLYKISSNNHIPIGPPIYGTANYDYLGRSFALSATGWRIAVGSMYSDVSGSNSGQVTIYDYYSQNNIWMPVGSNINGANAGDHFGHSLSFSADDETVAIGAYGADPNGNTSGQVKVYALSGYNWFQKGNTLDGQNAGDYFGLSTTLSASGNRLVVGAPYSDFNGSGSGHIAVFDYDNGSWTQSGMAVNGDDGGDYFGVSVSITQDGTSIAVGARGDDDGGNYSGSVQIIETCPSNTKSLDFVAENLDYLEEFENLNEYTEESALAVEIKVNVFPNPTAGLLEITGITPGDKIVLLYNSSGALVFKQEITENSFDIGELPTGIYHLNILHEGKQYSLKVVKR